MNKDLEKKLFDEFDFFKPERPMTEALMCFGFDCDDGWYEIIYELCKKIKKENIKDFEVVQVKEKLAQLCFYTTRSTDKVFDFIQEASAKSEITCEVCGEKGSLCIKGYWYKTLCKKCAEENGYG